MSARKRAESLQDVPVAISVISAGELQNNLATDLMKLSELTPQVVIGKGVSGTGALITIRGISSSSSDPGLDQSVAINFDGVPLSRGRVITASLFDMQQVEVLSGPQALFFGKNSPAGVISLQSSDPTSYLQGAVRAGYEFNADERYLEAMISGPVTDTLKARLAIRGDEMDGWIRNVAQPIPNPFQPSEPLPGALHGKRLPETRDLAGRLTLLWTPSEDFEAKLKLSLNRQEMNGNAAYGEPFCVGSTTTPRDMGVPLPFSDCKKNRVRAETALPAAFTLNFPYAKDGLPYQESHFTLASLSLDKTFERFSLTSTTGYYDQTVQGSHNGDYTEFAQIFATEREKYRIVTEELRLSSDFSGPVNFMVGAYLESADRDWSSAPDLFHIFNPAAQSYISNFQTSDSDNESYSAFAQLRWQMTSSLELAGGARYTRDTKKSAFVNVVNNLNGAIGRGLYPQGQILESRYEDSNVSPEVTLTWKPSDDQTWYGAYKAGYKAGGIANAALLMASATPDNIKFGAEEVDGFEIGYKADLFDRTLRADLVGYRYDYDGLQVTTVDPVFFRSGVRNAANARTTGVTASLTWLATAGLSFNGNIGYNRARYLNFRNAPCFPGQTAALGCVASSQDLSGKLLNRAPETMWSLGADYRVALPQGWTADLSVSGAYSSSYQTSTDYGPGGYQSSYHRLNAAIRVNSENERLQISLIGRNLTNAYYLVYAFGQSGVGNSDQYVGLFNRPREVVLELAYRL